MKDGFNEGNDAFIKTATEIKKVNIGSAIEARNEKIDGVLDAVADLPPHNVKVNDAPKFIDIFGNLFENKILVTDDENFLNDLLTKITDATVSHVAPEVKYVLIKTEEIKPKFEDVVIKKNT